MTAKVTMSERALGYLEEKEVSLRPCDTAERHNVKKFICTITFSIYLALSLINQFFYDIYYAILLADLLGLLALILLSTRIRRDYIPIYIYIGLLATSFLVSSLITGKADKVYLPICFILCNSGIAMILIRGYVYSWGGYLVFYSMVAYFFISALAGFDSYSVLTLTSVNGISIVILVACISLYILLRMENKKIDLKPALITVVISIWGIGRSGIGASFVLLFGLLFMKLQLNRKYFYIAIIILSISFIFSYWFFDDLYKLAMDFPISGNAINHIVQRWTRNVPDPRLSFWANYFNNLDFSRLIFGANILEDPWPDGELNNYNYHNSFIHLHSQTGIMGLNTIALIIFAVFTFRRTNKVFFILMLAFIVRCSTDLFMFFRRFDFIAFFFIFYFLKSTNFRSNHIKFLLACTMPQKGALK